MVVVPVVSLPGWYIEDRAPSAGSKVWVRNLKDPTMLLWERFGPELSESRRREIAAAILSLYPDLPDDRP